MGRDRMYELPGVHEFDTPPCDVCGKSVEGEGEGVCDCPECPVCGVAGLPECYVKHGLRRPDHADES